MIIGIDIDDTVSKTNERIIEAALEYDVEHVRGKGFKNRNAYSLMEMFYWSVVDLDNFLKTVRDGKFFLSVDPIEDAAKYVNKMKEEGNKIIFITRRQNTFNVKHSTKKWLKKHGFNYDKLILGGKKKGDICNSEGISFFIDNDVNNVLAVKEYSIDAILMGDRYNQDEKEVVRVNNWEEAYKKYKEVLKNGENS